MDIALEWLFGVHLGHDDFMLLKFRALQAVGRRSFFVGMLAFLYDFKFLKYTVGCFNLYIIFFFFKLSNVL